MRKIFLLALCVLSLFGCASRASRAASGKAPGGQASAKGVLLIAYGPNLVREPATKTRVSTISVNIQKNGKPAVLNQLAVYTRDGRLVGKQNFHINLRNISGSISDVESLKRFLGFGGSAVGEEERKKTTVNKNAMEIIPAIQESQCYVEIDLKEVNPELKPGDTLNLKVVATYTAGSSKIKKSDKLAIPYQSHLPGQG